MKFDTIVVGAGLTGLTAARYLADKGKKVLVFEQTNRIGGLCKEGHFKGTRFSIYGPHIFHTSNKGVWDFLSRFTDWTYFNSNKYVKSFCKGKLWSIPIDYDEVGNKEWDRATMVSALYHDYTAKMWGSYYEEVKGYSIKRLNTNSPLDKRYFKDTYQAFPANGYDEMFYKMIDNKNISITLNSNFDINYVDRATPVIYTGRIDHLIGRNDLPFMQMGFQIVLNGAFPWSDTYGVINFPQDFDFIRAHSSKILYQQNTENDVVVYEYPRRTGPECYPIYYEDSNILWNEIYVVVKKKYPNVYPAGRAGMFQYMDMGEAVMSGIDTAHIILEKISRGI